MKTFIKRNLYLFFYSRSTVFFSLLGALITFVLYIVFLKHQLISNFNFESPSSLLDPWVIGGTLTVTAMTTTLHALSQMIVDRESGTLTDFLMTTASYWQLQLGYLISAVIVGITMQLAMLGIMYGYFHTTDNIEIPWSQFVPVLLVIILSSLVWTAFGLLILNFVKRVETIGHLGSIIGTLSGFIAGVYMPIGALPDLAQSVMKLTPAIYNAALFRSILMQKVLDKTFVGQNHSIRITFERDMGIQIKLNHLLNNWTIGGILVGCLFGFLALSLLLNKSSRSLSTSRV